MADSADNFDFKIAKLDIKSGDVLVAKFDMHPTREQADIVRELFKKRLPPGVEVLVLGPGCDLAILSFEEIERRKAAA